MKYLFEDSSYSPDNQFTQFLKLWVTFYFTVSLLHLLHVVTSSNYKLCKHATNPKTNKTLILTL